MSRPLVSIVIATFNQARLLVNAIESVLRQTYDPIELIVVNDGSSDDTTAVLNTYAGRAKVLSNAVNQGSAAAKNRGLDAAAGEFVGFLDHDDLFESGKIARQVAVLEATPDADIAICGYHRIDFDGRRLATYADLPTGDVLPSLVHYCFLWSGAPLFRRKCIDVTRPTGTCCDYSLWLAMGLGGHQFVAIHEPLGSYRRVPSSMVRNTAAVEADNERVLDLVFETPDLPGNVLAVKAKAYSHLYFYTGCCYAAAGLEGPARARFHRALAIRPDFLADPHELGSLFDIALDIDPNDFETIVARVRSILATLAPAAGESTRADLRPLCQ